MKHLKTFESHSHSETPQSLMDYATSIDDLTKLMRIKVKNTRTGKIGYINDEKIKKDTLPNMIRVSSSLTNDSGWIMRPTDLVIIELT